MESALNHNLGYFKRSRHETKCCPFSNNSTFCYRSSSCLFLDVTSLPGSGWMRVNSKQRSPPSFDTNSHLPTGYLSPAPNLAEARSHYKSLLWPLLSTKHTNEVQTFGYISPCGRGMKGELWAGVCATGMNWTLPERHTKSHVVQHCEENQTEPGAAITQPIKKKSPTGHQEDKPNERWRFKDIHPATKNNNNNRIDSSWPTLPASYLILVLCV